MKLFFSIFTSDSLPQNRMRNASALYIFQNETKFFPFYMIVTKQFFLIIIAVVLAKTAIRSVSLAA